MAGEGTAALSCDGPYFILTEKCYIYILSILELGDIDSCFQDAAQNSPDQVYNIMLLLLEIFNMVASGLGYPPPSDLR